MPADESQKPLKEQSTEYLKRLLEDLGRNGQLNQIQRQRKVEIESILNTRPQP